MKVFKYIEESLYNFVTIILQKYFDYKTSIIFLSAYGAIFIRFSRFFFPQKKTIEKFLGMFFMILPENNYNYNITALGINQKDLLFLLIFMILCWI